MFAAETGHREVCSVATDTWAAISGQQVPHSTGWGWRCSFSGRYSCDTETLVAQALPWALCWIIIAAPQRPGRVTTGIHARPFAVLQAGQRVERPVNGPPRRAPAQGADVPQSSEATAARRSDTVSRRRFPAGERLLRHRVEDRGLKVQ